jgi:chromosome segregation ATPase
MPQLAFALAWLLTVFGGVQATKESVARATSKGNNVIAKVVEMLQNEKGKIIEDLKEERSNMDEYFDYCDTEKSDKQYAIKQATSKIEDFAATIEQATGQIEEFNEEIMELSSDIADRQGELDKAKKTT